MSKRTWIIFIIGWTLGLAIYTVSGGIDTWVRFALCVIVAFIVPFVLAQLIPL